MQRQMEIRFESRNQQRTVLTIRRRDVDRSHQPVWNTLDQNQGPLCKSQHTSTQEPLEMPQNQQTQQGRSKTCRQSWFDTNSTTIFTNNSRTRNTFGFIFGNSF